MTSPYLEKPLRTLEEARYTALRKSVKFAIHQLKYSETKTDPVEIAACLVAAGEKMQMASEFARDIATARRAENGENTAVS